MEIPERGRDFPSYKTGEVKSFPVKLLRSEVVLCTVKLLRSEVFAFGKSNIQFLISHLTFVAKGNRSFSFLISNLFRSAKQNCCKIFIVR